MSAAPESNTALLELMNSLNQLDGDGQRKTVTPPPRTRKRKESRAVRD
jgi:hypothetical protein